MARSTQTDFLLNARFWVRADVSGEDVLQPGDHGGGSDSSPQAGFNACSVPEGTTELVKYREGHYIYERAQLGLPTMANITLSRGVAKTDTAFYLWWKAGAEGGGGLQGVRGDLYIKHFHRDDALRGAGVSRFNPLENQASREYLVHEALPTRHKVSADLDATANEISIADLEVGYEWYEILEHNVPSA